MEKTRQKECLLTLPKNLLIAVRRGQEHRQRAFLRLFPQKIFENPVYRTLPLLYSCQNKKTQEGTGMKDVELRYVGGHVEVYTGAGAFLFSADTLREAMEELDAA